MDSPRPSMCSTAANGRRRHPRARYGQRGQAMAEFAIAVPVVLVLLLAVVQLAAVYNNWVALD